MILNLAKLPNIKSPCIDFTESIFPGGEVFIRLDTNNDADKLDTDILCRLNSSEDIMKLVMSVDAIKRLKMGCRPSYINAWIPYIPYARQDRVCNQGESHSLKAFSNILNSLKLNKVICYDPHSSVTEALIDNLEIQSNASLVDYAIKQISQSYGKLIVLSPDAGQSKKIYKLKFPKNTRILECAKIRDLETTKILQTVVPDLDIKGLEIQPIIIIDDICDGGRTFIEIAKEVRKQTEAPLFLIVSHGIFSHGEDELKRYFIKIYTTNSIRNDDYVIGTGLRPVKSSLVERINIFSV